MYLTFSDSAKFADIARNLVQGLGYTSNFNFWAVNNAPSTPPLMPLSIAAFIKIFGVNDLAVKATSSFYFILTIIFVYYLAKKIFNSQIVGLLSGLVVSFNYDLIDYATKGASESAFIFEIVAAAYFITLKKRWATVAAVFVLILMYFTRLQSFIYIGGLLLYYLLLNLKAKRAIIYFVTLSALALLFDRFVIRSFHGKYFLHSIVGSGITTINQFSTVTVASDTLRGTNATMTSSLIEIGKNLFYNLYNFYKLLPQILNPYLFVLFAIGIFRWGKNRIQDSFKIASLFMIIVTLVVTAVSIPLFRYIHPIIPLVYIIAAGTIVWIIENIFTKSRLVVLFSTVLVIFFAVGQTLGIFLLDSRFERNTHNVGKPPVYVQLSYLLRDNTNNSQVVVTNLDTWGSWYGERKTIWFPLEPKQLIDSNGKIPFDAIYLTSYLIDDSNYYMGADWREIFNNPEDPSKWTCDGCQEITKEFKLAGVYKINASEDYERQDATAILLLKK